MSVHRFVWPNGNWPAHMTTKQYESACKVAERFNLPTCVEVHPGPFGSKSVMIQAAGMWIGVEEDGYTHT